MMLSIPSSLVAWRRTALGVVFVVAGCAEPLTPPRVQPKPDASTMRSGGQQTQDPATPPADSRPDAASEGDPPPPKGSDCKAECEGRACGTDGCGGVCGTCTEPSVCDEKTGACMECEGDDCKCTPSCDRRICGSDGCDGSCGPCEDDELCVDGRCKRPVCGDGTVDGEEECDGSDDCKDDCTRLTQAETTCLFGPSATDKDPVCKRCVCLRCTEEIINCYLTGNATRDAACRLVAECGYEKGCTGLEGCICGPGQCRPPNGPCLDEASTALETLGFGIADIRRCIDDPECAFYRAELFGLCTAAECPDECLPKSPSP